MNKIKLRIFTLILLSIVMMVVGVTFAAPAKACTNSTDYFTGSNYCGGGWQVLPSAGSHNGDQAMTDIKDTEAFINRVWGNLVSGDSTFGPHSNIGASFIVLNMLGAPVGTNRWQANARFNEWADLVRQYSAAGRIEWEGMWNYPSGFNNSRVFDNAVGAGYYTDSRDLGWLPTIIFHNPDGSLILIKKNCANFTGSLSALQKLTGTIQGYKVEVGTKIAHTSLAPATVTATSLATGVAYNGSGNPYSIGNVLANQNYRVTAQSPPGWKLVGFYYGSSYYPGSYLDVYLNPGATIDIWPAYERLHYPWLQTEQGNVTSLNTIKGQLIGTNGGRASGATNKEAEFVIIGAASGDNFCSSNAYALGSNQYSGGGWNCGISQYIPNTKFTNINGIADNIRSIMSDSCKNYPLVGSLSTTTAIPGPDVSGGCKNGKIWKSTGNTTITGGNFAEGRATIFVEGDLVITGNILANQAGPLPGERVPNLGIYATGDITVAETVTRIDASMISQKTIKTCSENYKAPVSPKCTGALEVRGMLASSDSSKSFEFGRRATTTTGVPGSPAELIIYQGKLLSFPPPEFTITKSRNNRITKYETNLPPRF